MKLAIIILNWNGLNLLQTYLPSVVEFSRGHAIYLIDNNSSDASVDFVLRNYSVVKVIRHKKNFGFAYAYNLALKQINTDVFCLLNNDVRVTNNWTKPIISILQTNPSIAVVQPKILSDIKPDYFEYAGAGGGFIDNLGYPFCRGRLFGSLEKDLGQYNDTSDVFWASGACFFIRKTDFERQKGFDEDFFAHQEEIDLCWRLNNESRKIVYCGKSTVYHFGGATLSKSNKRKTYLNIRNSLLMLCKNLPKNKLLTHLFIRMIFDGLSALYFAFKYGLDHLLVTLKAHKDFYLMINKTLKKRKGKQLAYNFKKFIAFQYFIMKRTKWNHLK